MPGDTGCGVGHTHARRFSHVHLRYALASSFGVSVVYAATGQNFSGGCCILVQIVAGVLLPGAARANIVAVMIVNSAISQAMGTLGDLKTARLVMSNC